MSQSQYPPTEKTPIGKTEKSNDMTPVQMFSYGAVGGCCPTLTSLAGTYSAFPNTPMPEIGVFFGLSLFAVIGGVIARAFSPAEIKAALVAGISAPAIVTNLMGGVTDKPNAAISTAPPEEEASTESSLNSVWPLGVSVAFAQPSPSANWETSLEPNHGEVSVRTRIFGGKPTKPIIDFSWNTGNLEEINGALTLDRPQTISIPEDAQSLTIEDKTISVEQLINQGNQIDLEVTTTPTFGGDILWSLGAQRRYRIDDVELGVPKPNVPLAIPLE